MLHQWIHLDGASAVSSPTAEAASIARRLGIALAYCVAYVAVDLTSRWLSSAPFSVAPWYPQSAIAVALMVRGGIGYAPAVLVAAIGAEWLAPLGRPLGLGQFASAVGLAVGHCIAGLILARWSQWCRRAPALHDVTWLVVAGLAASAVVAATVGLAHLGDSPHGSSAAVEVWGKHAIGNLLGLVVLGPLLLLLLAPTGARARWLTAALRRSALRDFVAFCLTLATILLIVFALKPFDEFRMFYLMFLPMIAVSMRYGLPGAALALPLVQLGLIVALAVFTSSTATALEFQLVMLVLALTSLYLGAVADERRGAAELLAQGERELREQREALSEAQRTAATAELAAAVAHDLNQPLSAIGTYAKACHLMVERGEADRSAILRTLDQLAAESARAGQYVRRMRDFFRTGVLREEVIDVRRLIETAHAHLRDRLEREGITWRESIAPDLPAALGDAVQVAAVLDNLLVNACDALHQAPGRRMVRVVVTPRKDGPRPTLWICVEDSGPGIAPEVREQLFKPLATSKPQGMGLGLALSRSIAERLGGRLWLDDDAQKTTFCLELPTHG